MAFDHPIEADRIDDFNLFSAFVRAPLWILGGVLGGSSSSHPEDDDEPIIRKLDDSDDNEDEKHKQQTGYGERSSTPRVVSDAAMSSSSSSSSSSLEQTKEITTRRGGDGEIVSEPWRQQQQQQHRLSSHGMKGSKNLSWSDESGRRLVEYNDESIRHEPSPYHSVTSTTAPKPVKSAMKRSRSVKSDELGLSQEPARRYIPRMNQEHGLIMPTRPYGAPPTLPGSSSAPTTSNGGGGGVESPQWGWYINTTPPTPEMYHSHASIGNHKTSNSSSTTTTTTTKVSVHPQQGLMIHSSMEQNTYQQNHVFRDLQNANQPIGWTSVPI